MLLMLNIVSNSWKERERENLKNGNNEIEKLNLRGSVFICEIERVWVFVRDKEKERDIKRKREI